MGRNYHGQRKGGTVYHNVPVQIDVDVNRQWPQGHTTTSLCQKNGKPWWATAYNKRRPAGIHPTVARSFPGAGCNLVTTVSGGFIISVPQSGWHALGGRGPTTQGQLAEGPLYESDCAHSGRESDVGVATVRIIPCFLSKSDANAFWGGGEQPFGHLGYPACV